MSNQTIRSMDEQADMLAEMVDRCTMADGIIAKESFLRLEQRDVVELLQISQRLKRLHTKEFEIRQLMRGK